MKYSVPPTANVGAVGFEFANVAIYAFAPPEHFDEILSCNLVIEVAGLCAGSTLNFLPSSGTPEPIATATPSTPPLATATSAGTGTGPPSTPSDPVFAIIDCDVDLTDAQTIAARYGAFFGGLLYSKWLDLEPALHDLDIDIKDIQKVFGRQGSTCQVPVPAQPPLDPPTPFGD